ncbi:anhydro-N-acetylmuramic acid kinase [Candidatus Sulfurimonas marisnigri]|uniref:Anhydro-N-acetylmuramic acid kinase n=1 Tax=Candidatus Sulfurimonas marisnigri TaxID=2740405 RepID=A0A7S7M028_9BACT|nr:anhydro-N-acetylmuramic acid kinase [Candidatus Sulfurimonas marisnigri]QOY54638.1 anhydro-N-acetylmuramic acid kinase [Candidatus Sulfurimonas marisnigri]
MGELYIGVMSGTSLDGVDVVLCKIDSQSCELVFSCEYPFDDDLKEDILSAISTTTTLKAIGEIDTRLGKLYANHISAFMNHYKINQKDVRAIGLHGQTLWHEPNSEYPFSMQLGNASVITAQTGVSVVSDFRQKDIALGGQGAPFAPVFHQEIFSNLNSKTAVLNIGGMANISILGEKLIGYDTGCGNVLLDYWIFKNHNKVYDKDGEWAESGHVSAELLDSMLSEPYFKKEAPKSCGRELFNAKWLEKHLENFSHVITEDVQATLLELTAVTIANEVKKTSTELLIVCGGGARNGALMKKLHVELKEINVTLSDKHGVSSEFMEAMAFAWLAYKRIHKEEVALSSVTGASRDSILGCIYE